MNDAFARDSVMRNAVETKTCGSDQVRNTMSVQSNCKLEDIES